MKPVRFKVIPTNALGLNAELVDTVGTVPVPAYDGWLARDPNPVGSSKREQP